MKRARHFSYVRRASKAFDLVEKAIGDGFHHLGTVKNEGTADLICRALNDFEGRQVAVKTEPTSLKVAS